MQKDPAAGFTLIELAMVLVIIGLVVGGILVGRSLIRQAELRSVQTDIQSYRTAINTFRLKYNCLPGDCPNATNFFETVAQNGNGDGFICRCRDTSDAYELFTAWYELELAGYIRGHYTGVTGPLWELDERIGINVPASRIGGAGYSFDGIGAFENDDWIFSEYGNVIRFGKLQPVSLYVGAAAISGNEAYALDAKYDDGEAARGNIMTWKKGTDAFSPDCATTADATTAIYNRTDDEVCALIFKEGF